MVLRITVSTIELQNKIVALIQSHQKEHLSDIVDTLNIFLGTIQSIVTKKLEYQKICAHRIPYLLNEDQLALPCETCLEYLTQYRKKGNKFLDKIIPGDETWCHYYTPASKKASST